MANQETLPTVDVSCSPRLGLFDRMFAEWTDPAVYMGRCLEWVPPADISQTESEYIITAELPGIDMNTLDVSFSDGVLTVQGEKKRELFKENETCCCSERYAGSFRRSFSIAGGIKEDEIDALYRDGVLRLVLPKSDGSRMKKIEVKH